MADKNEEEAKRLQEIQNNLLKATDNLSLSSKELQKQTEYAKEAIAETVKNSGLGMNDQQKLMSTVQQINNLLARAKKGEDVTKELNNLNL